MHRTQININDNGGGNSMQHKPKSKRTALLNQISLSTQAEETLIHERSLESLNSRNETVRQSYSKHTNHQGTSMLVDPRYGGKTGGELVIQKIKKSLEFKKFQENHKK